MDDCLQTARGDVTVPNVDVPTEQTRGLYPAYLPPEILLQIFHFAANDYDPNGDFGVEITHSRSWITDLRTKKAVIRVCKTWRDVGMEGF